jgi:hypothetical protein
LSASHHQRRHCCAPSGSHETAVPSPGGQSMDHSTASTPILAVKSKISLRPTFRDGPRQGRGSDPRSVVDRARPDALLPLVSIRQAYSFHGDRTL